MVSRVNVPLSVLPSSSRDSWTPGARGYHFPSLYVIDEENKARKDKDLVEDNILGEGLRQRGTKKAVLCLGYTLSQQGGGWRGGSWQGGGQAGLLPAQLGGVALVM